MENQACNSNIRIVDLALAASRKRQSPRTGFVHLSYADGSAMDTVPLFENACFCFALLSQKNIESIVEGKNLLERLLAFQVPEGNFPIYLHEFPKCFDPWMALKIAPVFVQMIRRCGSMLGHLQENLETCLKRILSFSDALPRPPLWEHRFCKVAASQYSRHLMGCATNSNTASFEPKTCEEWYHWFVSEQMDPVSQMLPLPYDSCSQLFLGGVELQEKGEPKLQSIEWALAEKQGFSKRLLCDHPAVLTAAFLQPIEMPSSTRSNHLIRVADEQGVRFFWNGHTLHSLSAPRGKWIDSDHPQLEDLACGELLPKVRRFSVPERSGSFALPLSGRSIDSVLKDRTIAELPVQSAEGKTFNVSMGKILFFLTHLPKDEKKDCIEVALYCDLSAETEVLIEEQKGTAFRLGDRIQIKTPAAAIHMQFALVDGIGDFCGQISRANRPAQTACKGELLYEVFDWRIALRTLRRSTDCSIEVICELHPKS